MRKQILYSYIFPFFGCKKNISERMYASKRMLFKILLLYSFFIYFLNFSFSLFSFSLFISISFWELYLIKHNFWLFLVIILLKNLHVNHPQMPYYRKQEAIRRGFQRKRKFPGESRRRNWLQKRVGVIVFLGFGVQVWTLDLHIIRFL